MPLSNCVVQKVSKNMILNKYIEEISNTKKQTNKNSRDNDDSNCMQPAYYHYLYFSCFCTTIPTYFIAFCTYHYCSLAKEGPWAVHLTYGLDRGWADIQGINIVLW